ncbi:DUF2238 domain-containing protein [Candidatus Pacearchaeota archaeon]|nr:DUF2238 domain-containing protein [Candidatus Pacearchaeota archaeon]
MNKELIPSVIVGLVSLMSLIRFALTKNWEFIFYVLAVMIFFYSVIRSDKIFNYPRIAIWGLAAWVVMHMAGGVVYIKGIRLYDFILISLVGEPYNILKYDQLVHFFCYIVIGLLVCSITKKYFGKMDGVKIIILILIVLGTGTFYELLEFGTVVMLASTGVGGYYNLILDLFFDLIGATIGVLIGKRIS